VSNRTKAAVAETLPALFLAVFPGHGQDAPLDLPPVTEPVQPQIRDRLVSPGSTPGPRPSPRGNRSRPIRLHGGSQTVDATTGEVLSTYSSRHEPLGITHVRCGNRRATECPPCSRLYAADTFQAPAGLGHLGLHTFGCGPADEDRWPSRCRRRTSGR
jgi:hypothetical protein